MRKKLLWLVLLGTVIVVSTFYNVKKGLATPANPGFVGTTISQGRFGDIDVFNHFVPPETPEEMQKHGHRHRHDMWLSWQKTKGNSDVYVQSNVWEPGGSTGWHSHPGHSLITITAGTVTAYEGDDPDCTPHVYTVGMGFVDSGGDHVHIVRNEGTVEARAVAVQLIPAGQPRRIDAPDPGNCPF